MRLFVSLLGFMLLTPAVVCAVGLNDSEQVFTEEPPVRLPHVVAPPRQVEVVNFPTDDTGAIRVSSSGSQCDCSTNTLVAQLVDEYRLGHDEEFVTDQVDLLEFYGGQVTVQLVVLGEPNTNITVLANALWTIVENQAVAFQDPDGSSVQLFAPTSGTGGSDIVINQIKGRFLKIRLKIYGNGATVSVHVMAIR